MTPILLNITHLKIITHSLLCLLAQIKHKLYEVIVFPSFSLFSLRMLLWLYEKCDSWRRCSISSAGA